MSPLVSVVLTVYRRMDFFPEALASALNQSFTDREIIVADDSGCFAAREICRPYVEVGLVRYRPNPHTLGVATSLRDAIKDAQGTYVAVLNDDDVWEPDFLKRLVQPLEQDSRRILAFSDHWIIREDGTIDPVASDENTRLYGRDTLVESEVKSPAEFVLVLNGVPLAMAAVFRKDAVVAELLVPAVAGAYDFWISCILAAQGGAFFYVPQRLTRYRVHPRMETGRRSPDKSENQVYIFSEILKRGWFPKMKSYVRSRLAAALFRVGREQLYFDRRVEARRYFRRAFRERPTWKPLIATLLSLFPCNLRKCMRITGDTGA